MGKLIDHVNLDRIPLQVRLEAAKRIAQEDKQLEAEIKRFFKTVKVPNRNIRQLDSPNPRKARERLLRPCSIRQDPRRQA